MILAYTDFQLAGPYRGELEMAVMRHNPAERFVHLMHDAPTFDPGAAGQLLAALSRQFRTGDVCLAVIDPGVGGARRPAALEADGCWFVGPDNGLLAPVARQAEATEWWEITWRPEDLSTSFHGRDLFAPFAARLAAGKTPASIGAQPLHDPVMLAPIRERVIYLDGYGNAVTALPGDSLDESDQLQVAGHTLSYAFTFDSAPAGTPFWYVNSMNRVEIAVNQASAAGVLDLRVGTEFAVKKH